jgi:hypothetical protein
MDRSLSGALSSEADAGSREKRVVTKQCKVFRFQSKISRPFHTRIVLSIRETEATPVNVMATRISLAKISSIFSMPACPLAANAKAGARPSMTPFAPNASFVG